MAITRIERILILCKTYPSPSGKYAETSCVAGMTESGEFIRLYPVPFRLIRDDLQFKKWQWIRARIQKAQKDHRPESHTIFVDTIALDGNPISTQNSWATRRSELNKLPLFSDFADLEGARQTNGGTLGLLRPARIDRLEITKADNADWTAEELQKLVQHQNQGGLFDDQDHRDVRTLRKLPHNFHYHYECLVDGETRTYRHKIADWEAGALYWRCVDEHGSDWEAPFRQKLETELPAKDLQFLMGTIHRFPDQWLIISVIYPPKLAANRPVQAEMIF
ncbi:hypothetical protein [Sphingobium sp. SA916]|uniref:hypothetical protein n=1 Tax=Sphingobium sp. SA916 TaxID=1851207 RepID=UPI000C9F90AF|nr:hypothetical protein [Sphingobium sp. SA916]PNQ04016.1 hypothetical protein A8G00_09040 [Sphingobium sp. SA916]